MNEIYLPIKNFKQANKLEEAWEKLCKVICSCKTIEHKISADVYLNLFINKFNLQECKLIIYEFLSCKFNYKPS